MPKFVLLLIVIFILSILQRIDRRNLPKVSFASWIPTFWILILSSKPLCFWFKSCRGIEEGSVIDRNVLTALFCSGLIILVIRKFNWPNTLKENFTLMLVISYMLVSLLWSDIPFLSLKRWNRELIVIVMALVLASETNPRKALESVFRRIIYLQITISYIFIHYFSEYGRTYKRDGDIMWVGVAMHKNTLAQVCIFSIFFLVWSIIRRWQGKDNCTLKYQTHFEVFLIILSLYLMGGPNHVPTYSATSFIALLVGLTILITMYLMDKYFGVAQIKALIVIFPTIIGYGVVTPMIGELSIIDITSTVGRSESLTGRSEIWEILFPMAMQNPLLGSGFGAFWTGETRSLATVSQAHNGYLDIILNLGFLGLILQSIFVLSCAGKAQKAMIIDFDWGVFWFCWLLIVLLHNISESSINSFANYLMAILIFLLICVPSYKVSE